MFSLLVFTQLLWLLIFGPSLSVGLSCYTNATTMIDCDSSSLHLADYYTPACLLVVWKANLTTYQSCFLSPTDSPANDSCQLTYYGSSEDSWTCLCDLTGCNNVSVIKSLDMIKVDINPQSSEALLTSTVNVNSMTVPEGELLPITHLQHTVTSALQKQAFHNRLPAIIGVWTGVFIMTVVIVATVGAFFRWMCLCHKKPEMNVHV